MHSVHVAIKHHVYRYLDTCADLGEGSEGSRSPFFWRVLQKTYDKKNCNDRSSSFLSNWKAVNNGTLGGA